MFGQQLAQKAGISMQQPVEQPMVQPQEDQEMAMLQSISSKLDQLLSLSQQDQASDQTGQ